MTDQDALIIRLADSIYGPDGLLVQNAKLLTMTEESVKHLRRINGEIGKTKELLDAHSALPIHYLVIEESDEKHKNTHLSVDKQWWYNVSQPVASAFIIAVSGLLFAVIVFGLSEGAICSILRCAP